MATFEHSKQVLHQELALDSYLNTLLEELPVQEWEPKSEIEIPVPDVPPLLPVPVPRAKIQKREPAADVEPKKSITSTESVKVSLPLAVMPEWSRSEFQALFFKVGQLILATPLTELSRTIKFERAVTKIPGQPSWFMGLLQEQDKKVGILDTSQLIFGKNAGQNRDLIEQPFKSMLITQDGNWALACDEVLSIGKVVPEQVRWRTYRKTRPWLIGTVIEELVAVIDISRLTPRRKNS